MAQGIDEVIAESAARLVERWTPLVEAFALEHEHGNQGAWAELHPEGRACPCSWLVCRECAVTVALHVGGCDWRDARGLGRPCVPPTFPVV